MFGNEAQLVAAFVRWLEHGGAPWMARGHHCEFDYISGRTDVVAVSNHDEVLAFEAKLKDWRKALRQAWRSTSFAHRAYVVLPIDRADAALRHRAAFDAKGVGLCLVDRNASVVVAIDCVESEPVLPWLREKARSMVSNRGG